MRPVSGCLVEWLVMLLGLVAYLTLVYVPFFFVQDAIAVNAYRASRQCGPAASRSSCRLQLKGEVTSVQPLDSEGRPVFLVQIRPGEVVTITEDGGTYQPREGDAVVVELWRNNPARVSGPDGAQVLTNQYPENRVQRDRDRLGLFLFVGLLALLTGVPIVWAGRHRLLSPLVGPNRSNAWTRVLYLAGSMLVVLPATLLGEALGWLPPGRNGIGITLGVFLLVVGAVVLVRRRVRARSS
jgi:hypothetical protein